MRDISALLHNHKKQFHSFSSQIFDEYIKNICCCNSFPFRKIVYDTSLSNITSIFIAYIKTTKTCLKITSKPQQIQETHVN